jgi:hypothetical protein
VTRIAENERGRSQLDDPAVSEDHRPVADVVPEREVVRDEENAEPARLQVAEQVEHVDPGGGVEHADDLVGDEELEVEEERARDQQPLELSPAELMRVLAENVCRAEADGVERPVELLSPLRSAQLREVLAADHREDAVDLEDRVVRAERILEDALNMGVVVPELPAAERRDVDAVEGDRPAVDAEEPEDHPADRRLPAAALADQRHHLAGAHVEADVAHREQLGPAERTDAVGLAARVECQHPPTS